MTNKYGAIYEYSEGRKVKNLLPMLKEAGIDILNTVTPPPAGDIGLAEVKQEVGDRICLRGYIEAIPVIEKGAPASICEAVREAILTAAIGGGFIIGTTPTADHCAYCGRKHKSILPVCRDYGNYRHLGRRTL